jgi:hypothetical protein
MDADVNDTHTIYVQPRGKTCSVLDADVRRINVGEPQRQDYQCVGVVQDQGPIVFTSSGFQQWPGEISVTACGQEGDLGLAGLPPPNTPQQIGVACGWVTVVNGHPQGDPTGPETCFVRAYTSCRAATLDYVGDIATGSDVNVLSVLPQNGVCKLYDQLTDRAFSRLLDDVYTCTGLIQRSNGLAIPSCWNAHRVGVGLFIPAR